MCRTVSELYSVPLVTVSASVSHHTVAFTIFTPTTSVGQQTGPGLVFLGGPYGSPARCLLSTMRREPTSHLWKFCGAGFGVKVKEPELWMLVAKEYRYDHAAAHCWEYGFPEGVGRGRRPHQPRGLTQETRGHRWRWVPQIDGPHTRACPAGGRSQAKAC